MSAGASQVVALIRVPRGAGEPSDAEYRQALAADRERLRLPPANGHVHYTTAGPYHLLVAGQELDEYVCWEI